MQHPKQQSFEVASARITDAAMKVHHALREALDAAAPSLDGARACGRALGLRRHLGWQVYTMAHASDHAAVIAALPKARGWQLVMQALQNCGCADRSLRALRQAVDAMHAELTARAADRSALRAVAAGALDTPAQRSAMLRARANATRANELLHGVGVKTYLSASLIGPVRAGGKVGMATATSIHGVQRSRPGAPWPIYYTLESYDEKRAAIGVSTAKHRGKGIPPLQRDLCSPNMDMDCLRMHRDGETRMVELLDRGSANTTPLDLAFVEHIETASVVRDAAIRWRLLFLMTTPTERTVTEVWFHRSVKLVNDPAAMLMSSPNLNRRVLAERTLERLPLEVGAVQVAKPTLPLAMRQHAGVHAELLQRGAQRLGAPLDEFVGFQLSMPNPPWMSMVELAFDC